MLVSFTHILSIEMFEHMKNYPLLFAKLSRWLRPKGKVFIHVFVHKDMPYEFEEGDGWMSKTFFSGGTMPSVSQRACGTDDDCMHGLLSLILPSQPPARPIHLLPKRPLPSQFLVHPRNSLRPNVGNLVEIARRS